MTDLYYVYAQKLSAIGDRITKVSDGLLNVNLIEPSENIEAVKTNLDICFAALNEYKDCKSALVDVNPPECVEKEHSELIEAVQMFIDGTDLLYKAVNMNEKSLDKNQAIDGLILQNKGKNTVIRAANKISLKLE